MSEYVIAIRRDARDSAPADWLAQIGQVGGVTLTASSPGRARVEVDDDASLGRLVAMIGSFTHVEPLILHDVLHRRPQI